MEITLLKTGNAIVKKYGARISNLLWHSAHRQSLNKEVS